MGTLRTPMEALRAPIPPYGGTSRPHTPFHRRGLVSTHPYGGKPIPLSIKISRTERMPRGDKPTPLSRGDTSRTPLRRKGPYAKKSQTKKSKRLAAKLCRCIKRVRRTQAGTKKEKEKAAIGICITSVLHSRGKTVKRFHCRPSPYLQTLKKTTPITNTP